VSEPARSGPLSGLLVADFSRVLAGPYCTMLLADLGADVIKVESPGGDDTRSWMPPVTKDGVSTYFLAINRNKRSVALDLKDDGDRALAQELARRADVFVQNFKPGGLARFGLDYDTVSAGNPSIIYASISGFGSGGGKDLPGYDLMVQAMSGLMSLTGDPEGPPYRAGISAFDVIAGLHTTIAILAALNHRNATGEGQHLDASLMASAMSGMVNQTSAYAAGGDHAVDRDHAIAGRARGGRRRGRSGRRRRCRPLREGGGNKGRGDERNQARGNPRREMCEEHSWPQYS